MTVRPIAAAGFQAGAEAYARGRPGYPVETVDWLRRVLRIGEGLTALDLAAGTGKFTPRLLETGASVVAVEPSSAMRAQFAARFPGLELHDGSAEAIPLPDCSVDAVVAAQAFHWFATPAALAEIRRVLKPGGALGLIWNVRNARMPWVAELSAIVDRHEEDAPRYWEGAWRAAFPAAGFGPLSETRFPHAQTGPAEAVVVDRSLSTSFIAALPAAEYAALAADVRALIARTPQLQGETVSYPYVTEAYAADRTD